MTAGAGATRWGDAGGHEGRRGGRARLERDIAGIRVTLRLWALLTVAAAAGCATAGQFRTHMDAFLGRPIGTAQDTFGYNYVLRELEGGERAYTWNRVVTGVIPGYETPTTVETLRSRDDGVRTQTTTIYPGTYYPPQTFRNTCEFTFIADGSGTIVRWHAQGDACRGAPGGRVLRSH
ncbi:MAG: hypothetical protein ACNA8S_01160 [Deferrisomatales bacterium]